MIRSQNAGRIAVSVMIVAAAAATMFSGVRLLLFSISLSSYESLYAAPSPSDRQRWIVTDVDQRLIQEVSRWRGTAGIAAAATRVLALDERIDLQPLKRLRVTAEAIGASPTDGLLWLAYAREIVRSGFAIDDALAALDMSRLMARREQAAIFGRVVFTLAVWDRAPPSQRSTAMRELRELRWFLHADDRDAVSAVIQHQPPAHRAELRKLVDAALTIP